MQKKQGIFVQIASYRDPECEATINDLFAKADKPENITIGLCWQYKPGDEPESPTSHKQVKVKSVLYNQSKGANWAKREAQKLYDGEAFVLMIDGHMRFVPGWDRMMIEELNKCAGKKSLISHHPPRYIPPEAYDSNAKLSVLAVNAPTITGEIRVRGEQLHKTPPAPLKGAFVSPGFIFAPGKLVNDVPYDPYLYFEQEEICMAARLHTHGWNVYHPTQIMIYHLYDSAPVNFIRYKHWNDNTDWSVLNNIAKKRRDHLLGFELSEEKDVLKELDNYGHGDERGLDEYGEFCGINFSKREVMERALNCEFITEISRYRDTPIQAVTTVTKEDDKPHNDKVQLARAPSAFTNVDVNLFKPASLKITQTSASPIPICEKKSKPLILEGLPAGLLVIENYLSPEQCKIIMDYADKTVGMELGVVDHEKSTKETVVSIKSQGRITEYVQINGMAPEILNIFMDIYSTRLSPYYDVKFEWFERPQILRYKPGGKYNTHADAEHYDQPTGKWFRSQDRDYSVLLYLNEEYEGGAIAFESLDTVIQPKTGMLVAFPSDHRYQHTACPTTSGMRYVIVSWAAILGSPRVQARPAYASIVLNIP